MIDLIIIELIGGRQGKVTVLVQLSIPRFSKALELD